MERKKGIFLVVVIVCISYLAGCLSASKGNLKTNDNSLSEEVTGESVEETSETEESTKEQKEILEEQSSDRVETRYEPDLTLADGVLLDRHLYGQWVFTERLLEVEEYQGVEDWNSNFSDQGVEEMKKIVINYDETEVYAYYNGQSAFQDTKDMYLYMIYGGANPVYHPVYHVEYNVDPNKIHLLNLVNLKLKSIQFPGKDKLVNVYYNLGYDDFFTNPATMGQYLGSNVYIDPADTETIYLEFCGLWKLERYQGGHLRRNGKQYDTGL